MDRSGDEADRRRKLARLTPRGIEALAMSAMIFNDIRSRWQATLGDGRLSDLEAALRTMVPGETFRPLTSQAGSVPSPLRSPAPNRTSTRVESVGE